MQIGDLVKWYVYYACGTVVKDAGLGIIISSSKCSGAVFDLYDVFSNELTRVSKEYISKKENDVATFDSNSIDLLGE